MLQALKNQANITRTENNAITNFSTGSDCLNLFATIGALRDAPNAEIIKRFTRRMG
ncbi:MAG: DUF2828 domain-containing protein [Oscillospiraceae bacterium]|nr:DUF2828 domain-containing protein [Oscillospiraceae bacterium]